MPASPALPLVFVLCPFRGLSFVQRQHVEATVAPVRLGLVKEGMVPLGLGEWADHPLPLSSIHEDQELWKAFVRSLVLRCDRVVHVAVEGVADDALTDWIKQWAPKHAIAVQDWASDQ